MPSSLPAPRCWHRLGHRQEGLLFLFAIIMIVNGVVMLHGRGATGRSQCAARPRECRQAGGVRCRGAGLFSGFFGIGGGFLIVPGLNAATGMPMLNAVGSSLVAVSAFGETTATNYALSGLIDWPLAAAFIGGKFVGSFVGTKAATGLAGRRGLLTTVFAALILVIAAYMLWKSYFALFG